ncbi:Hypothetical predicted protein [Paramuricea clavata]|uniref:Generative cell specific-1/HAP2 domain-containing protein n=1 Tax=Paramuricea clavata TaxID=317549 RepID=A0A6S7H081_PARCT|nr:Hypothetical predicted protein [Paramuricea clavata]
MIKPLHFLCMISFIFQTGTESFLFTTNKVYDSMEKEQARLYYPFTLSVTKSKLRYVYPFFYETTVNNHPYEEVRTKVSCRDGFWDTRATCGFAHDHKGNRIWDSQGFCCSCSMYDTVPDWAKWLLFGGHANEYYRGGQGGLCGYSHKHDDNDKFSHCMRMDDLWYDVFSIREPRLSFVISIQAFEQVKKVINNKTITEWVDGGKIKLNYQKRSGFGQYGRLLAKFHGTFESTTEIPNLVHKYLLIPKVTAANSANGGHVQIRNGFHDYMLIPSDKISIREGSDSCDMVGVSYSSFRKLGGGSSGRGSGCNQKPDSCLNNQPKDLFEEDTALRNIGRTPNYFVEQYGKCVGVNTDGPSEDLGIVYEVGDTVRNSLITLEVSADDMVLIYNRANGIIVKSFATDFDALSQDGTLTVIVQNTGLVTADFYVVFSGCSEGVYRGDERMASINPKSTHMFTYDINVYMKKGKKHFCAVQLFDSRRHLQDTSNVTFKTYTPCVCLHHCICKCNELAADENDNTEADIDDCQNAEDYDHDYDEDEDEEDKEDSLLTKILKKVRGFFNPVRIVLIVLLFCGVGKAMIGRYFISVAKLGLGGVRIGEKVIRKVKGEKKLLTYDAAMNLVDTTNNTTVILNHGTRDFFINIIFFYLLPIILLVKIAYFARGQRLLKQLEPSTSRDLQQDVESALPETVPAPKQTTNARRIIPKKTPNMKAVPKLKANVPKLKGGAAKK